MQISRTVDGKRKRFSGGCFDDREKAEAKARELATAHGERGAKAACAFDQLPIYVPMKPCKGVTWSKAEQLWRAQVQTPSGNLQFRARPKNHSKEELERSFDEAFQWVQQQKGKATETKDKTVTLEEALEELMDQERFGFGRGVINDQPSSSQIAKRPTHGQNCCLGLFGMALISRVCPEVVREWFDTGMSKTVCQ